MGTPVGAYIHKGRQTETCTYESKNKKYFKNQSIRKHLQKTLKENPSKQHNMILSQKDTQAKTQTKRKPQMQNKNPHHFKEN